MKRLSQIVREIIPVIFGILIALFINNWNEGRKDRKYLEQVYSAIEMELRESNEDIIRVIPKQMAAIDTIDAYLNNNEVSLRYNDEGTRHQCGIDQNQCLESYFQFQN